MKHEFGVRSIVAVLVLILMAPISLVAIRISSSEQEDALEKAGTSLVKQVELRATAQARFLEGMHFALTAIAQAAAIRDPNANTCSEFLRGIAPMARSNSPTCGQSNSSGQDGVHYQSVVVLTARREAASLSL